MAEQSVEMTEISVAELRRLHGIVNEYNTTVRVVAVLVARLMKLTNSAHIQVPLAGLEAAPDFVGRREGGNIVLALERFPRSRL